MVEMLHQFLSAHRTELIARCRAKVAKRIAPKATPSELESGVPLFLDQLIKTLKVEQTSEPMRSRAVSGPSDGGPSHSSEIGETAALHGGELLEQGFTVDQVVHDYGDLCQAITGLAVETGSPIDAEEFQTFNRCLDNGIAGAVTEFSRQRDTSITEKGIQALNERLGFLAHELRNHLNTATLAVTAIKAGNVGITGATGAVLDRSLLALSDLIDRSLAEVRVTAGMTPRRQRIPLAAFIADVKVSASFEARARGCPFTVGEVDKKLMLEADHDMLFSALGNLLQNAFKYTARNTEVSLNAYAAGDRILIEVGDHCGGLPPGAQEKMFLPFTQGGADKSGLGLGLSIAQRSVEANNGRLRVRDQSGSGCVFTIDLPLHSLP